MNGNIRYAAGDKQRDGPAAGAAVRIFRALILLGVWILVGLAGLAVWARLAG